jgi:GNAT superfamily N-acetyltransferase
LTSKKASIKVTIEFHEFDRTDSAHLRALTTIWNEACGPNLSISERFAHFNTQPSSGGVQAGRLALVDGQPVGVVLASLLRGEPTVQKPEWGWIDALAVVPVAQRQGIGGALLTWAEAWLAGEGCRGAGVGCSLRPFTPGVPVELETRAFFETRSYAGDRTVWDMAANLAHYQTPATVRAIDGVVRPAGPGDAEALLTFLRREFPGRWRYEAEEFLRNPSTRLSDYMLLWTERGVDGFCIVTFEDSGRPIERFYPYQLPRPWGQLGSVGVSADCRGRGYGAALVDAGLRRLHDNGINGCIIDWLVIVDFYAKFGFSKHREYRQLYKVWESTP